MPAFAGMTRETWMAGTSPAMTSCWCSLQGTTLGFVARHNFANGIDHAGVGHGELRLGLLLQIFVAVLDRREIGAKDQILDGDLWAIWVISLGLTLNDDARCTSLIGILYLRSHLGGLAEIKLGADAGLAELLRHLLVVGDAVAVEHQHHHGALRRTLFIFAEALKAEQEPRDADGDAGGRNLLAGEALDQAVIATAAHHRAEPDGLALFVHDGRRQIS